MSLQQQRKASRQCRLRCGASLQQQRKASAGCAASLQQQRKASAGCAAEPFRPWPSVKGVCAVRKHEFARGKSQNLPRYPRFKVSPLLKHGGGSLLKSTSQARAAERFRPWPSISDVCAVRKHESARGKVLPIL